VAKGVNSTVELGKQMEQFSIAYCHAVASVAGLSMIGPVEPDDDSVDYTIGRSGGRGSLRSPRLDVQLKATAQDVIRDEYLAIALPVKNYSDLRASTAVPRLLMVVVMPEDASDWLTQSEEELCMRRCGYWLNLRGSDASENEATVTVHVPRANQFTVEALRTIMDRIAEGEQP